MFKLLIVDDDYLVRMGLRETVPWGEHEIEIVGEAENGRQGLEKALQLRPDIIITDVKMPVMDGLALVKAVKSAGLDCAVIILSGYEEFEFVREAMHNGAFAYLLKPVEDEQLLSTVSAAAERVTEERSTKQYYNRLREELSAVKKQFLRDLFDDSLPPDSDIEERLRFYNISVSINDCRALCISVDDYDDGEETTDNEAVNLISDLLTLGREDTGLFVDMSGGVWFLLLDIDRAKVPNDGQFKELIMNALSRFESKTGHTVSVGISNRIESIKDIGAQCKSARQASESKPLRGLNSVAAIDDVDSSGYKREIQQALKYISEHYGDDVSVETVAKELYISSSYLMHLFKDELGKTFNECLTDCRISMAKELLRSNRYKIYEVSSKVGYRDVKYFSQIFKRATGMTPSEYSKKLTDGE